MTSATACNATIRHLHLSCIALILLADGLAWTSGTRADPMTAMVTRRDTSSLCLHRQTNFVLDGSLLWKICGNLQHLLRVPQLQRSINPMVTHDA